MSVDYPSDLVSERYSVAFRKAVKLINVLFEDFHNHEIGDDDVDWYRSYFDVILIQYAENEDGEELKDSRLLEFRVDGG